MNPQTLALTDMSNENPKKEPCLFDTQTDWQAEWNGMPEFVQDDLTPFRVINLRFRNEKDVQEFARLVDQIITPKQKALWFPKAEHRKASHLRYES